MLASLLAPLTLIAALADAPPVPAEVHAFSPDVGTRGTVIEVEGLGFGEKRPRAWLEPDETGKRRRLRVIEHADDRVAVQLRAAKMPAGAYALVIAPRGRHVPKRRGVDRKRRDRDL